MSTHGYLFAARLATRASSIADAFAANAAAPAHSAEQLTELIARRTAPALEPEAAPARRSA